MADGENICEMDALFGALKSQREESAIINRK